jgi:hypothetical protein
MKLRSVVAVAGLLLLSACATGRPSPRHAAPAAAPARDINASGEAAAPATLPSASQPAAAHCRNCAGSDPAKRQYFDQRRKRYYYFDRSKKQYFWENGEPKV